jgi:hypothetical protein
VGRASVGSGYSNSVLYCEGEGEGEGESEDEESGSGLRRWLGGSSASTGCGSEAIRVDLICSPSASVL